MLVLVLALTTVIGIAPASADANIGECMAITLEYCPSTGFAWTYVINNPNVLELVSFTSEPTVIPPENLQIQGGSYYGTWTFKFIGEGTSSVTFKYKKGNKIGRIMKYSARVE